MGRSGAWLASVDSGVTADVVSFAKGLGNGFPIGACLATGPAATLLGPGSHGTTFGGDPVAAAAGLAVIGMIGRDGLRERALAAGSGSRPESPASASRWSPPSAAGACSGASCWPTRSRRPSRTRRWRQGS